MRRLIAAVMVGFVALSVMGCMKKPCGDCGEDKAPAKKAAASESK
jgi:hypothetical protein